MVPPRPLRSLLAGAGCKAQVCRVLIVGSDRAESGWKTGPAG